MSQDKFKDLSFDAVIPSHLLLNRNLEPNAKILYAFIRNLTKKEGYCYASNSYLAELMDVDIRSVQIWLVSLKQQGYIEVEQDVQRRIYLTDSFLKKCLGDEKIFTPPCKNLHPPHEKIFTHNEDSVIEENNNNSKMVASVGAANTAGVLNRSSKDLREELVRSKKLSDEQVEEALAAYSKHTEVIRTKNNPVGYLIWGVPNGKFRTNSIQPIHFPAARPQTPPNTAPAINPFEVIKASYPEIAGRFIYGRNYFEFINGPAALSDIIYVGDYGALDRIINGLRKMGVYRGDLACLLAA